MVNLVSRIEAWRSLFDLRKPSRLVNCEAMGESRRSKALGTVA